MTLGQLIDFLVRAKEQIGTSKAIVFVSNSVNAEPASMVQIVVERKEVIGASSLDGIPLYGHWPLATPIVVIGAGASPFGIADRTLASFAPDLEDLG